MLWVAQHADSTVQEEWRTFVDLFLFCLHQLLVPIVKAVAEHLLSWPLFRRPGQRAYQEEKWMCKCVCVCDTVRKIKGLNVHICVYVHTHLRMHPSVCWDSELCSCWGSPPDGCPLFPLSVSLALSGSLCPSLFMGLPPFFFFQCTPQLNLCPWTEAFLRV